MGTDGHPAVIHAVSPSPPACVLRASPDPARRWLELRGEGFPTTNHGLQFRRLADDALSIIFDMEVDWLSATRIKLDLALIRDLLWRDPVLPLAVRLMDTTNANYRPLSDWSAPFTLAEDAAASGMPEVESAGVPALPKVADRSWNDLLHRLDAMGFFRYAEPGLLAEIEVITGEIASFYELCVCLEEYSTLRSWSADGEDLFEGGVVRYLERMAPFFATQGIAVTATQELDPTNLDYTVTANGRSHTIYTRETVGIIGGWAAAAINYLALVNTLLVEADSEERAYAPSQGFGGDGSRLLIVTPAMTEAINASELVPEEEKLLTVREITSWLA
jgi:hypothetical protein